METTNRTVTWLEPDDQVLREAVAGLSPKFTAVLDTNALIDLESIHSIIELFVEAEEREAGAEPTPQKALRILYSPELKDRRERARDALLLAIHLDAVNARTFCARSEYERILTERSPPSNGGVINETGAHTTLWLALIKDRVLPGWSSECATQPDTLKGSAVDDALIRFARLAGVPLITNEAPNDPKKIPAKAAPLGVQTMTPAEFARVSETGKREFMDRFTIEAATYLQEKPASSPMREVVRRTEALYSQLLK